MPIFQRLLRIATPWLLFTKVVVSKVDGTSIFRIEHNLIMEFLRTEGEDSGAGDAPRTTSFEKQDSFASLPVETSMEKQSNVETSMEKQSNEDAEVSVAAEQQPETDSRENQADVTFEEHQSELDSQQSQLRTSQQFQLRTETIETVVYHDDRVKEKTFTSTDPKPETERVEVEMQDEDTSSVGLEGAETTTSGSVEDMQATSCISQGTQDIIKEEHRTSYTIQGRNGGEVFKEHVVVTVESTEVVSHGEREMETTKESGERREEKMDTSEKQEEEEEDVTPPNTPEAAEPRTPRTRGRTAKAKPTTVEAQKTAPTTGKRGRKRKVVEEDGAATPAKAPKTPGRGRVAHAKVKLSYTDYVSNVIGERVLSCGEGEQLGHPGRTTTKKPRKVDLVEDEGLQVVQVVAGGVHSALLTADGEVYMCGINEQGTVPAIGVEPEGSTDKFTKVELSEEIASQGKIVMLAAGASFTAALTDKGSVIAWGNLRDTSGEINVHPLLTKMKEHPVVLIHYKKRVIVKIAAGENHLVMLEEDGKVLTFGDGKMGQLGRSKRTGSIRPQYMVDEDGRSLILILQDKKRKDIPIKDIHAGGFWTMLVSEDQVFSFGLNNFEHLGIPIEGEAPSEPSEEDKRELRILTPCVAKAYLGRSWTHIDGVQHIIARDERGEVYGIGKNTDNALGLGTWTGNDDSEHWKYSTLERIPFPREAGEIAGTTAKLGCSVAWTKNGDAYAWGCDTSGQLGLGLKDDDEKIVPTPRKITSAHLDGYKIICASISDNHCLFLAKKG
uniref:Regulator of chromosome condensation n=2 Tax=Haemonchus contortus TaxID=6289 RepID=A0A7I5E7Y8_HAECO